MLILIAIFFLLTPNLYAANPYHLGEFDYFYYQPNKYKKTKEETPFDWKEIYINQDGIINTYIPPKVVLALLEDPTPENAKSYLNWHKQRVKKIMKAQEMINQIVKKEKD